MRSSIRTVPGREQGVEAVASATVSASITIEASAEAIFAILIDPAEHAAIDGTGWVCDPIDRQPLAATGQMFRMAMYNPGHPNGNYEITNRVEVFDPPHTISWKPGYDAGDGALGFGGWIWRYDLAALAPSVSEVRLTYDWSAVCEEVLRRQDHWPPFSPDHLDNSLTHLAELVLA